VADDLPNWYVHDHCPARAGTLIAGPYLGEFGHELFGFQGYVRRLRKYYEQTLVISYDHSEYLYEGCEFVPHGLSLARSGYGLGRVPEPGLIAVTARFASENDIGRYDHLTGSLIGRGRSVMGGELAGQEFIKFHEPIAASRQYDMVFHFRAFVRRDGSHKNYTPDDAAFVVGAALREGYSVACVGHPDLALCPRGAVDERAADLRETIRVLSNARLAVGGSSGTMHLASLCAIPVVVWAAPAVKLRRYLTTWNPHGSPVHVVSGDTFRPKPEAVLGVIRRVMADLKE
jgi:hypothetical protein